ncbi:hypothetical protein RhiirA4_470578 [Rhizophagus irregularis]|uniref:Uncharacterized protein n=1 Tax=Rhizophagus irregularis TaxID=588596 RepID=A0A2I1H1K0_9GLOM|nr:hypothetical protein RhiirA4_470578 [Rhizophagus irregularis]
MPAPYVKKINSNNYLMPTNINKDNSILLDNEQENIIKRSAQAVQTSFKDVKNLVTDINNKYEIQIKNPRTWIDHNIFLEKRFTCS